MIRPIDSSDETQPEESGVAGRQRASRFGLTVGDQVVSALSNFSIAVVAARLLTHSGFGAFSVGITVFVLTVGACRDTIGDMVLIRASGRGRTDDRALWSSATGAAFVAGLLMALVVAALGASLGGDTGRALLAIAIVLPALTVQDILRHCFIAGGRSVAALVNDISWLGLMVPSIVLVHTVWGPSAGVLLLAWGMAGSVSALLGCLQARIVPDVRKGVRWLQENRRQAGHYLGEFVSVRGAAQIAILGLGPVAGVGAVGATRGVHVLFGPITVIVSGMYMALTSDATTLRSNPRKLRQRVVLSAGLAAAIATAWTAIGLLIPDSVGRAVLGSTWSVARPLILFNGIGVIAATAIVGPLSGLRALRASHHSFHARVWSLPLMLILSLSLASVWGAKGFAVGSAMESTATLGLLSFAFARANALRGPARENIEERLAHGRET